MSAEPSPLDSASEAFVIELDVPLPSRSVHPGNALMIAALDALYVAPPGASVLLKREWFGCAEGRRCNASNRLCNRHGRDWYVSRNTNLGVRVWRK